MFKLSFFLLTLFFLSLQKEAHTCSTFCIRKEWRTLSIPQRQRYVNAVTQLRTNKPESYHYFADTHSRLGYSGIHKSAQFLPWHRYFLMQYQASLRTQAPLICLSYWDALEDKQNLDSSPVFNITTGFGALTADCVLFPGIGQITDADGKCVRRTNERGVNIDTGETANSQISQFTFAEFSEKIELGYHSSIHIALGGDQTRGQMITYRSPADPIFFLHHCNVDRLWALWQSQDFDNRLTDLNYPKAEFPDFEYTDTYLVDTTIPAQNYMDISKICYRYYDVPVKYGTTEQRRRSLLSPPSPPTPTSSAKSNPQKTNVRKGELDLGEVGYLRKLDPIPNFWIDLHRYNKTRVREFERERNYIIDQINNLDGYLSLSARVSSPGYLKNQLLTRPDIAKVVFTVKGDRLEVPFDGNYASTAEKIVQVARAHVQPRSIPPLTPQSAYEDPTDETSTPKSYSVGGVQNPKDRLRDQLASIIGKPVFESTNSINPFDAVKS